MPLRLGLTALLTILAIILTLRIIGRIRAHEKPTVSPKELSVFQTLTDEQSQTTSETPPAKVLDIKAHLKEIGTVSELLIKTAPSSEIRQNSQKILDACRNAENLLQNQDLLSAKANMPNYKPVRVDFHDLIKAISRQSASQLKGSDVTFTFHLDPGVPEHLFLDEVLLRRILKSLLSNSLAMTQKGRIHLHVTATNPASYDWSINLIVADTGKGFPNSFKERLRATQSVIAPENNEELNLLAVKKLLPVIKGDLKINSVMNKGTEVSISFPARAGQTNTEKSEIDAAQTKTAKDGPLNGKRILIIEDDVSSQKVLQTFLVPEGCQVHCIPDGNQAMKTLETNEFDLVLMDVRMDGLDGIKTTQAIRNSRKPFQHVPIIAITADVDPDTNAKCMMAGADLFLNKPIGSKALFDGIRFVMDLGVETRPASAASA